MIVTVFPDRSWIVQEEPTGGAPPMVGTGDDEHRIPDLIHILDFIHQALEAGQKPEPEPDPSRRNSPRIWTPRETDTPSSESRCPAAGVPVAVSAGHCLQAVRSNPNPNPQRQTETLTRKEPTPCQTPWRKPSAKNT